MKTKTLSSALFIGSLALFLAGCSKEPAPQAPAPKTPVVMKFDEAALFEFDKADLKPEGKEQLSAYREQARSDLSSAQKVKITGYTDNTGTAEHNLTLSLQRAEAVRDYLASVGVAATKMEAVGAGEANPIADNSTTESRARNRRVEIEVSGLGK